MTVQITMQSAGGHKNEWWGGGGR